MTKIDKWTWVAPVLMVVGIFAVYLTLTYLPLADFGVTIPTASLWLFMPWIIALVVAVYVLKTIARRR